MEQMPEMTALELEAEIIKRFKRVPSCRDIRAEYLQIVPPSPREQLRTGLPTSICP